MLAPRTILIIEVVVAIAIVIAALFLIITGLLTPTPEPPPEPKVTEEVTEALPEAWPTVTRIGSSVESRAISTYRFGTGEHELLFVGGVHGGYEWNSVLLAYEMIDHLTANPDLVPDAVTVTIIPVLNPDGLAVVTGAEGRFTTAEVTNWNADGRGRFNANSVDLNRNFGCKWSDSSTWRGAPVNTGTAAFSEPEAVALRDYVLTQQPIAVVFWHSVAGAVYASECDDGVQANTLALMNDYARAANYNAVPVFDAYPITGDAEGWLASLGIPAVTVELIERDSIEWTRNLAGTEAVITNWASYLE